VYRSWHRRQVRVVPVVVVTGVYLLRVSLLLAILLPVSLLWGCSWHWRQTQNWSSLGIFIKFRNGFNGLKKQKVKIFCQSPCKVQQITLCCWLRKRCLPRGVWKPVFGSVTFWYGSGSTDGYLWLTDPDPAQDLLFLSVTFKTPTKIIYVFCLLLQYMMVHLHHSSKIKSHKEVTKDGRIRIRTSADQRIRIREAKKLTDPDPLHCWKPVKHVLLFL